MDDKLFDIRKLRACMVCGYVQSFDGFLSQGCPNCEDFLSLRDNGDRILDSTSGTFVGLVGITGREGGWVVRWKGLVGKAKGLYAGRVMGRLTEDVEDICGSRGIQPVIHQSDLRR